ncbi:MAG: molecular chaperone TorD family protein [Candidatus Hydrogenedentes bacterium]|nr:molecular chaperone TorD family protein [Candidatus Hydrogenedentota bacterium]
MPTEETLDKVDLALARSALYGVLASAFRHPDNPLCRTFAGQEEFDALLAALLCAGGRSSEALKNAGTRLREAARNTSHAERKAAYVRLFGHTARGEAPPYETEYGTGGPFFQPQEMSDIAGFYRAFGLDVDPLKHERLDHISCECEFMCFLCAKEAYAFQSSGDGTAAEVSRAQRLFLRDHMGAFARTFFAGVSRHSPAPWHAAAADLGAAFIDAECERLGLALGRRYLTLRPVEELAVPMACGSCEGACASAPPQEG